MLATNLIDTIESIADPGLSAHWDNSGIQVAGSKDEIRKIAITLDPTLENINTALDRDADFILTHHPLTISPKYPNKRDKYNKILELLLKEGSWLYSAHTSLDVQTTGPVSWLAEKLELEHIQAVWPISPMAEIKLEINISDKEEMEQLIPYIRHTHPRVVIVPSDSENLFLYCKQEERNSLLHTLTNQSSPLEIESKEVYNLKHPCGYGIIGEFPQAIPGTKFLRTLDNILDRPLWKQVGKQPETIQKVSYCPGSGMDIAPQAFSLGAEIFISGDLKFHQAQELEALGQTIDVGHFVLEEKMMEHCYKDLKYKLEAENIQLTFIAGKNPLQEKTVQ